MSVVLSGIDRYSVGLFGVCPQLPEYLLLVVLVFAPTIGYIDQLVKIFKNKTAGTFRLESALIMLTSNFLRFLYLKHGHIQAYLVGQGVAVFAIQYALSILSLYYARKPNRPITSIRQLIKINDAQTPLDFVASSLFYAAAFTLFVVLGCAIFGTGSFMSFVLLISNIIDVCVSLPNFLRIVFKGDISGCSLVIIIQYLSGDILKLLMYILGGSQVAFILGAILQTAIDTTNTVAFFTRKSKRREDESSLITV